MIKVFLTLTLGLLSLNAYAGTFYKGHTKKGEPCSVTMNLESNNVTFFSNDDGFGFIASADEIQESLDNGENPVVLEGGDGPNDATLALTFGQDGLLSSALFVKKTFIFKKKVHCLDLSVN